MAASIPVPGRESPMMRCGRPGNTLIHWFYCCVLVSYLHQTSIYTDFISSMFRMKTAFFLFDLAEKMEGEAQARLYEISYNVRRK